VSRFVLTYLKPTGGGIRLSVPVGGDTTGIRRSTAGGELYYAVLDRPMRYRGADINQVILRPAHRGQAPHFGMRGFQVQMAPIIDPVLRTADPIDPLLLDFVADAEIDDASQPGGTGDDPDVIDADPVEADLRPPLYSPPAAVLPSPSRKTRRTALLLGAGAALVAGLIALVATQSRDSDPQPGSPPTSEQPAAAPSSPPADLVMPAAKPEAVLRLIPPGYPPGACKPETRVPLGALAALECGPNTDAGGPRSARYTLLADKSALQTQFDQVLANSSQQVCPGRIMSPGPWRRNANPEVSAGTLFCGVRENSALIAWTDDARRLLAVVESEPTQIEPMFTWWQSHS